MDIKRYFIIILICLVMVQAAFALDCSKSKFYLLNFKYSNGAITFIDKTIEKGCPDNANFLNNYKIELVKEGNIVYSSGFNPGLIYTDFGAGEEIIGGAKVINETEFSISVPYEEKFDKISVYKNQNEILTLNQSEIKQTPKEEEKTSGRLGFFDWVDLLNKQALEVLRKTIS